MPFTQQDAFKGVQVIGEEPERTWSQCRSHSKMLSKYGVIIKKNKELSRLNAVHTARCFQSLWLQDALFTASKSQCRSHSKMLSKRKILRISIVFIVSQCRSHSKMLSKTTYSCGVTHHRQSLNAVHTARCFQRVLSDKEMYNKFLSQCRSHSKMLSKSIVYYRLYLRLLIP